MTFEEWFDKDDANYVEDLARAAWGYQQNHIEKLEWDLGDVENALNNMKQINKHLRKNIADTQEKLDIERNRTEELEEQLTSAKLVNSGLHTRLKDLQDKLDEIEPVEECLFETQEEQDRYELEQAIMSCWGITDDLHLLADAMESGENKRMHHEMLLNLSQLYELKFQKLFKEFEKFTGCC